MEIDILIPVFQPDAVFFDVVSSIKKQTVKCNIHVIQSLGNDDKKIVIDAANQAYIPVCQFNHGLTRNSLLNYASSDFVLFLTQDAVLQSEYSVKNLLEYIQDNELSAAYGRQLPRPMHTFTEGLARNVHYQNASYVTSRWDKKKRGFDKIYSSNSFCIYNRSHLKEIGNFRKTNFAEDALAFCDLINLGYRVGYCAEALVCHSHNYTMKDEFRRNVEIGKFHKNYGKLVYEHFGKSKKGEILKKYLLKAFDMNGWRGVCRCLAYLSVRIAGYKYGQIQDKIILRFK